MFNEEDLVAMLLREGCLVFPSHQAFRRSLPVCVKAGLLSIHRVEIIKSGFAKACKRIHFDMRDDLVIRLTGEIGSATTLSDETFCMLFHEHERVFKELSKYEMV